MTPYKLLIVVLRVAQLLTTVYIEFTVTSMLIELQRGSVFLDNALLARVGLAGLALIWVAAAFCWSTCFNGTRVMAVAGLIGDLIATIAFITVAALSRKVASTDCGAARGATFLWSDTLNAWIDLEGAALSSSAKIGWFDDGFMRRQCTFGKAAFATSIATCVLLGASAILQFFLARESRRPGRGSRSKADIEMPRDNDWTWNGTVKANGYQEVK